MWTSRVGHYCIRSNGLLERFLEYVADFLGGVGLCRKLSLSRQQSSPPPSVPSDSTTMGRC